MPHIIDVSLTSQVSPFNQCQVHRRGDVSKEGCHQEVCNCHHEEEELCDQFWWYALSSFLEALQCRQRLLEIRSMPHRHRVGTDKVRTDPPVTTIYIKFFFCGNMGQSVHLKDYFFRASQFAQSLSEP